MTLNRTADRLAWLLTSILLVSVAWGNGWAILAVSLSSIAAASAFALRFRKALSRSAACTVLASALISAAVALIAWKVRL